VAFVGSYMWRLRQRVGHELVVMPAAQVLLIDDNDRVYLQRRKDLGVWEMPSGTCEPEGSFAQTAVQEVLEETGLTIDAASLVPYACISDPTVHIVTYPNGDRTHVFSICFCARRWTGSVSIEAEEVLESSFFDQGRLPAPLAPATEAALDLYRRFIESNTFQVR
jgi:8-oxo-dGTP pyrophosphatase MutT (NUDIX family)